MIDIRTSTTIVKYGTIWAATGLVVLIGAMGHAALTRPARPYERNQFTTQQTKQPHVHHRDADGIPDDIYILGEDGLNYFRVHDGKELTLPERVNE